MGYLIFKIAHFVSFTKLYVSVNCVVHIHYILPLLVFSSPIKHYCIKNVVGKLLPYQQRRKIIHHFLLGNESIDKSVNINTIFESIKVM